MYSETTDILYPNYVEVIAFSTGNIFPIFKNGSASLHQYSKITSTKILFNEQIRKLEVIEVILRDPLPRFISGVTTYVYDMLKQNPKLDLNTILYFVENYLFLNRHYSPQLSWLINLNRFSKAKLRLHGMEALPRFTELNLPSPYEDFRLSDDIIDRLTKIKENEMYLRLDTELVKLIGQELTFQEILEHLKKQDPIAYQKLRCIALD